MLRTITSLRVVGLMEVASRAISPGMRRLSGLLALLGVLALAARSAEAVCNRTWVGGVDSNFGTAGNWSPGSVPGSGDDACITATTATNPPAVADTYTVIVNGTFSVHSLTLGGPNGTQTLVVPAASIFLSLGAASAVTANGVLTLGDSGGGFSVLAGPGSLTNSGHLNTIAGGGGPRYLRTNVSNAGGTIDIGTTTNQDQGGILTNNGTVTVEAAGNLSLTSSSSFANNGGAVTNNGTFSVSGGTFTQRGGSESGHAVLLSNSTLDDDLGAGAGLFSFTGNGTLTGSGNNPGVAAGQVVTITANSVSTGLAKDLTNAGTINMGDSAGGFSVLAGPGALTNSGHLNTVKGGGSNRHWRTNITNANAGSIDIGTATIQDQGTLTTNNGTLTVEAAGNLSLTSGSSFTNNGGTVTNGGTFSVTSGTFTQRGGTESGNAVLLSDSTLDDDLGAATGIFTFTGNGTLTGGGSQPGVAAGQVVTIAANSNGTTLPKDLTNAGTIILGDAGGGFSILRGPGLLTNSGQLNTIVGGGGVRYLRLNITNTSNGTVDIIADTRQDASDVGATTFINNGMVTVGAVGGLSLSGGSSFANNGGAVINGGGFSVSGGTFTQRGGTESGNAVLLSNSTLDDDLGAGAGLFTFIGNGTLTGSGSSPGVAASQVVTLSASSISVAVGVNLTNAGTITLGDSNGGFSVLQGPGTLTNSGHLNTIVGGGGVRYFRLNISNAAAGTVDIGASDTRQDSGTLTTNNGSVMVEPAGGLALSSNSSFTNNGGAVINNGGFSVGGGTFTQRGGAESGHPVLLSNSTLDDDLNAGAGLFSFTGNGTLTGTGSKPGVAAGQVVTVSSSSIAVALAVNLTNAGTITLGDSNGGFSILQGPGALTNSGQLNTVQGGGGTRYFRSTIVNAAAGTIDIGASDTRQDSRTLTTNNGTVMIEAGRSLSLSSGSSFTQGTSGTFATTLDANTTTFGQLTGGGGPVAVDGKLRVTTLGSPMIGSSWPIISGAQRSGQFATFDFGSNNYDVQYPSTGVTLVTLPASTPTATSATATNTQTATPTSTGVPTTTATLSATPIPTHTLTATATQTRTATTTTSAVPTATTTPTSTVTVTQVGSATVTATLTSTATSTATVTATATSPVSTQTTTPTPTPTATATAGADMVALVGRVLLPGPGGTSGPHGQIPAGEVKVDFFLCQERTPCFAQLANPISSVFTDPNGQFFILVRADILTGKLPVLAAHIDPLRVLRVPVVVVPVGGASARATQQLPQAADVTGIVIDAISEAAVQILVEEGEENFDNVGIGSIVSAVQTANIDSNFAGLTVDNAVNVAQTTATNDPTVQMVIEESRLPPTPTPTPEGIRCVGDCDGSGDVTVDELIKGVNIALGSLPLDVCSSFDTDHSGDVTINELIVGVNNALAGCPVS